MRKAKLTEFFEENEGKKIAELHIDAALAKTEEGEILSHRHKYRECAAFLCLETGEVCLNKQAKTGFTLEDASLVAKALESQELKFASSLGMKNTIDAILELYYFSRQRIIPGQDSPYLFLTVVNLKFKLVLYRDGRYKFPIMKLVQVGEVKSRKTRALQKKCEADQVAAQEILSEINDILESIFEDINERIRSAAPGETLGEVEPVLQELASG